MNFKCPCCNKEYKRKDYYERHKILCEILIKTHKEHELENQEREDTPNIRDLYLLVQELTLKYAKLQNNYNELTKWVNQKKRKLNIIDWLNTNHDSDISFINQIDNLEVNNTHLEYIFKFDYIDGMSYILQELFPLSDEKLPIKAFDQKENIFFIFTESDEEKSWNILSGILFNKMINNLSKQLIDLFKSWQDSNLDKMDNENFAQVYIQNVKKVMGGNTNIEIQNNKIRNKFFKYLKMNLKTIIQYEFS